MIIAIGLGLFGLLLIYLEFFVPGGILAVLGGILMILGLVLFILEGPHIWWIIAYLFGLILLLIFVVRFALWRIRFSKNKDTLYAGRDQEGYVASSYDKELIGKEGTAITDLKPSGHVLLEDQPYQAVSEAGYITKGTKIKVMGGEGARLIVRNCVTK